MCIRDSTWTLGVHIADVSNYVQENSALDREALKRGTSVYLVDRVLPMLPERLSNGICSLNAGEDRLTMSCEMHIDRKGRILSYEIFPSVIHVRHRLSYRIVREILVNGDEELAQKYEDVVPMLKMMEELCLVLRKKPEGMSREESFAYYQSREPEELFDVKETRIALPEHARIFLSYDCDECGETTAESFIHLQGGKKLCRDCYKAYRRFDI